MKPLLSAERLPLFVGVVHRDFKPENVMLASKTARVKVRLARLRAVVHLHEGHAAAAAPLVAGTPYYMAPEILGKALVPPAGRPAICGRAASCSTSSSRGSHPTLLGRPQLPVADAQAPAQGGPRGPDAEKVLKGAVDLDETGVLGRLRLHH